MSGELLDFSLLSSFICTESLWLSVAYARKPKAFGADLIGKEIVIEDPREKFLKKISIESSTVHLYPHVVFFFGGKVADAGAKTSLSLRCLLIREIIKKGWRELDELVCPEEIKDWLNHAMYPDLLTFEKDLCSLSSKIFIVLESEGSIAELGAFSMSKELRKKVNIVVKDAHYKENSFIRLGLLEQFKKDSVIVYPYSVVKGGRKKEKITVRIDENDLTFMLDDIRNIIRSAEKTEKFKKEQFGHKMYLISELINMFKILTEKEIKRFVEILGVNLKSAEFKRVIFLLKKMKIVVEEKRGRDKYFLSKKSHERIAFSSKENEKFDRQEAIIGTNQFYRENTQKKRLHLLEESFKWS